MRHDVLAVTWTSWQWYAVIVATDTETWQTAVAQEAQNGWQELKFSDGCRQREQMRMRVVWYAIIFISLQVCLASSEVGIWSHHSNGRGRWGRPELLSSGEPIASQRAEIDFLPLPSGVLECMYMYAAALDHAFILLTCAVPTYTSML